MPYTNGSMDATNHMKTWGHCACYHVNLLQMKLPRESKNLFRFRKYVWMLCWRVQKWLESRKYYKCSHELWNPYEFTFSMHLLCTKLQSQCELYIIWSTDIVICMLPSHTDTHTLTDRQRYSITGFGTNCWNNGIHVIYGVKVIEVMWHEGKMLWSNTAPFSPFS